MVCHNMKFASLNFLYHLGREMGQKTNISRAFNEKEMIKQTRTNLIILEDSIDRSQRRILVIIVS